jgi:hypothetical protein
MKKIHRVRQSCVASNPELFLGIDPLYYFDMGINLAKINSITLKYL